MSHAIEKRRRATWSADFFCRLNRSGTLVKNVTGLSDFSTVCASTTTCQSHNWHQDREREETPNGFTSSNKIGNIFRRAENYNLSHAFNCCLHPHWGDYIFFYPCGFWSLEQVGRGQANQAWHRFKAITIQKKQKQTQTHWMGSHLKWKIKSWGTIALGDGWRRWSREIKWRCAIYVKLRHH